MANLLPSFEKSFLPVLGLALSVALPVPSPAGAAPLVPPHIILIVADDLGYADLGAQVDPESGQHFAPDFVDLTPNIDTIAANGVRFASGYVTGAVCSPSRAGFLTGRYQQRFGHENHLVPALGTGLPPDQVTVAENLRALGYRTYVVGKWHLGIDDQFRPGNHGFDEFFGIRGGRRSFFALPSTYWDDELWRNNTVIPEVPGIYLTDVWGEGIPGSQEDYPGATGFIDQHLADFPGQPFFLFMSFNAVHEPLEADAARYNDPRIQDIGSENRKLLAAMTIALDDNVGAILDRLDFHGITNNTLVVFMSDNGGPVPFRAKNLPLRGTKGTLWEGGIRVPFIVQWPATLSGAQTITEPVSSLDLPPTFVAAAGGTLPAGQETDGVDLLPFLTGQTTDPPHHILCWRRWGPVQHTSAVRKGDWKLIRNDAVGGGTVELYDLANDIGETTDLAGANPGVAGELLAALEAWECGMIEPLWNQGAVVTSGGAAVSNSDLGYKLTATGPGPVFGYGMMTKRYPLPLSHDWSITFAMDMLTTGDGTEGHAVLASGAGTPNAIRLGLDQTANAIVITETSNGNGTSVVLPGGAFPVGPKSYAIHYDSAANSLTLRFDSHSATHSLTGTYSQFDYWGYSVRQSNSLFSALRQDAALGVEIASPIKRNGGSLELEFQVRNGPSASETLEASDFMTEFLPVPGAVLTDLGGGQFRFTWPGGTGASRYFRVRANR